MREVAKPRRKPRPQDTDGLGLLPPLRLPEPTTALPGTLEKEAVLRGRLERREHLHHPLDSRRDAG